MERNSILRPHCSPQSEEEVSRQRNRLHIAQKSLDEYNQKLIAEITPTLGKTGDVEAAVSLARLQHSADRLDGISKKLEDLACGTKLDGQHNALESAKEAYRIIGSLQQRHHELANEDIRQHQPQGELRNISESNGHGGETGCNAAQMTSTPLMGVVVNCLRSQGSSTMISSLTPATACPFLGDLTKVSYEKRHSPPPLIPQDAMTSLSPYQKRKASHEVSLPLKPTASAIEKNNIEGNQASEGATSEAYAPQVLVPPGKRYTWCLYREHHLQDRRECR